MTRPPSIVAVLAAAVAFAAPPAATPCSVPLHLRQLGAALTPNDLALLSMGHNHGDQIPYHLAAPAHCVNGMADIFPCHDVDLLANVPFSDMGGGGGNDIWGWVDPVTGAEIAIVGRTNGTSFVDLSDPIAPVYLGNLPTRTGDSIWRGVKVYADHVFVVSDYNGSHGMQVFDLTRLRSISNPPETFTPDAVYDGFGRSHNIVMNVETGYAYATGSDTCSGGLHMIDVHNPLQPKFAGCYDEDGYTHDAQCVIYRGPDTRYTGREICFASNEDTVTVVDVTDKAKPVKLSRVGYEGSGYVHQGWLTEGQSYFIQDDELDEIDFGHNTRTYVWDVTNLRNIRLIGRHSAPGQAIDHNQFITGPYDYQAHYLRGLRVLRLDDLPSATLVEAGYLDTYPEGDGNSFGGAWGTYPFFPSHIVLVNDMNRGLFVTKPLVVSLDAAGSCPGSVTLTASGLTANGDVALFRGDGIGTDALPGGACAGKKTGLTDLKKIRVVKADAQGNATIQGDLTGGACGSYVETVDLTSCRVSNVRRVQ
jgi:choice-of-anchor B domain-containing protein